MKVLRKKHFASFTAALGMLAVCTTVSVAQVKPKPTTPGQGNLAPTKGTAQLPGDNGKLGVTYQLGEKDRELHFTLESAQVAPYYKTPEAAVVAGADQRLLLLTFTVQNPQKMTDMTVNSSAFTFTAVSPDDKNFLASGPLYQPENSKSYQTALKPAQKVRLQVVLPIYATGPVRKLIVQRGSGAVLRYDLSEQIGKMKTSFSPDSLELLSEVKVEFGKPFDVSGLEAEVQAVTIHENPVGKYKPYQDFRIFTVQLKLTNLLARPQQLNWNTLKPTLTDEDGQKLAWQTDYLSLVNKLSINQEVLPGEFVRGLLVFKALKNQKPIKLRLLEERANRTAIITIPSLTIEPK
ncbi:hypothetical protein [Armatimonas sp.]|uniref:hypothetical protein n=1 Tax=Armatimonas sp. TaxID=1872638 RepID=UPI00286B264D|nr:hypothetical protein [Armatimonas sp.]